MREKHINGRLIITRRPKIHPMRAQGRLEGAQLLAGALAHEVNNPLAIAVGFAEVLRDVVPDSEQETLEEIVKAHDRIAEVIADAGKINRIAMTRLAIGEVLDIKRSASPRVSGTNNS